LEFRRVLVVMAVVIGADFGGQGKAGGHRQADGGHLGEGGALAAEEVFHGPAALRLAAAEEIGVLCHDHCFLPDLRVNSSFASGTLVPMYELQREASKRRASASGYRLRGGRSVDWYEVCSEERQRNQVRMLRRSKRDDEIPLQPQASAEDPQEGLAQA